MAEAGPTLSAVVLCYNERPRIAACIQSLSFCDEIVVIDDNSTDGTWELLQTLKVRSIQHPHETFALQREYGKDTARGRWILSIDADEVVTPALAASIRRAVDAAQPAADGYMLRRRNPYPATLTGEYWSRHPRLILRDRCRWQRTDSPHAPLDTGGLTLGELSGHLEHAAPSDVASVLRKAINRSAIIGSQQRARGRRGGLISLLLGTTARFLKFYLSWGGWRWGAHGAIMAFAMAFEAGAKQAFIIEGASARNIQDGGPGGYAPGSIIVRSDSSAVETASAEAARPTPGR